MRPSTSRITGRDVLGAVILSLLALAWAPITSATYGGAYQRYFKFCEDQHVAPLRRQPCHDDGTTRHTATQPRRDQIFKATTLSLSGQQLV
jgi:hypothetical protein